MNLQSLFSRADNVRKLAAGEILFEEGAPGDVMYVVLEGQIEVLVRGSVVDSARAGDIVGELALIDSQARSATARAATEARVAPVDEKRFLYMVQQTPKFSLHVMRVLARRLRQMDSNVWSGEFD